MPGSFFGLHSARGGEQWAGSIMPRSSSASRTKNPSAKHSKKTSRALIVIDNGPILEALRRDYGQLQRQVEKTEREVKAHETRDIAAYQQWLHGEFGSELTRLRDCNEQIAQAAFVLDEVERISCMKDIPRIRAYHLFKLEQQGLADPDEVSARESEKSFDPSDEEPPLDDMFMRAVLENMAAMYEAEKGCKPPDYDEIMSRFKTRGPHQAPKPATGRLCVSSIRIAPGRSRRTKRRCGMRPKRPTPDMICPRWS